MLVGAAVVVLAVQCTAVPPSPPAEGVPPSSSVVLSSIVPPESAVAPVTAAELGASWRPGCPVQPEQLRRVSINHLGFDLQTHRGDLIVHHAVVEQVVAIFADLYRLGYPIEKMRTVEHYRGADDE
ncbi:MAG TPA: M15 family peptidase, partial [Mycobacterium sp.]|nr:M15 family peptidase [Mycobacterium sp.]